MNTRYPHIPWVDPNFMENQRNFPPEELDKYAGQQVAWSWDGTRILASGTDLDDLVRKLVAAGIDPNRVVYDYVEVL